MAPPRSVLQADLMSGSFVAQSIPARPNWVHPAIPGNAARIFKKK
jgi:hypothetical protein